MCVSSKPGDDFSVGDRPGSAPTVKYYVFEHRWRFVEAKRTVLDKIRVPSKPGGWGTHGMSLFINQNEKQGPARSASQGPCSGQGFAPGPR